MVARQGAGRKPKLTRMQKSRIFRWINGKNPMRYGFDFALWARAIVRELILQKFKINLSVTSVGSVLTELNHTAQKPPRRVYQSDPEAIERWQRNIFPTLAKRSKAAGAEIHFRDGSALVPMRCRARRGLCGATGDRQQPERVRWFFKHPPVARIAGL